MATVEQRAYELTDLFANEWSGMSSDGAQKIVVKPDDLALIREAKIPRIELEAAGLLTRKDGKEYWEYEKILAKAVAYENSQAAAGAEQRTR